MPTTPALVEPSVLEWARVSVGLQREVANSKLGLPEGRVEAWESGDRAPSVPQLRKAAKLYRRPLAVFFLPQPPQEWDAMRDFRRHPDAEEGAWSPELHGEYRRAQAQREFVLELAELDEEPPRSAWRLADLPERDEELGALARTALLSNAPVPLPTSGSSPYEHLNAWLAALEATGVLVMATARGGVDTSEMRAFSLYYDVVPVIVVNGADAPRGRLFSLLHEYAHLLLHTGGLCDLVSYARAATQDAQLEARCNAIAAAALMPRDLVLDRPDVRDREGAEDAWDYAALRTAALPFGVSAEAFLRRLSTLGRVSSRFYQLRRASFLGAYEREEAERVPGGGNWYLSRVRDLGKGYVRQIADAHNRQVIDTYTAASWLDVKAAQIPRLAEAAALPDVA